MSKTKLNEKRDDKKDEFKKEMGKFVELFMAFRGSTILKKAKSYIDLLKREIHTFPEFLKKYINKKFHANL